MLSVRTSLLVGLLLSCVLVGPAGAASVRTLTSAPAGEVGAAEAENLFTTVGITEEATKGLGEIYPPEDPFSLPAEEMPPSKTVGPAPNDPAGIPVRMPDTSGNVKNLAAMRGQTLTLRDTEQKPYKTLHFFGMTADGGPAGGEFTLNYRGGETAKVTIQWPDWCQNPTAPVVWAIGPLTHRHRRGNNDGAPCGITRAPVANPIADKDLLSITLPPATQPGGGNTQSYLMAVTLEAADGTFKLTDLSGTINVPDDEVPPTTTIKLEPGAPNGNAGWYAGAVHVTLDATDNQGGAGVEQRIYRIDGGPPISYAGPFDYTTEGEHKLEYRSIDGAGNAEGFKSVTLKVDVNPPTTQRTAVPAEPKGPENWYDSAVTLRLSPVDGQGSGVASTRYRVDGGEWTPYSGPVQVATAGEHLVEYASTDVAGNEEPIEAFDVNVDATAPTTTLLINGAAPAAEYPGAVRLVLTRDDGDGSGVVETQYRLDGSDWRSYAGAVDVTGNSGHKLDYRSIDKVGNVENFKTLLFTIRPTTAQPSPQVLPQATPAPKPKPSAALAYLTARVRTTSALRTGKVVVRVSCQAVDRGSLRLTVTRSVARRLKLPSTTLAGGALRCGDEGRGTLTLKPSTKVKRALARTKQSITATLTLSLRGSAGSARDKQTVTFRGKQS